MTKLARIPAISHEIKFVADHEDEVNYLLETDGKECDPTLMSLLNDVSVRADKDVKKLLDALSKALGKELAGVVRIGKWHWPRNEWWTWTDVVLGARGRRGKRVCWLGLGVNSGDGGARLIGDFGLVRGGIDRLRMFEVACTPKVEGAWLTVDHPARYPNWASELIWFDKKLLLKTAFEDLNIDVVTRAKAFLRAAKPLLRHE